MPFNRHGGGSGGFNRGGSSYGTKRPWDRGTQSQNGFDDRPKFKATCASCGNACEVPFKPNGSKPVYCRDCFKKEGNGGETRSFGSENRSYGGETRSFGGENRSFERRTDDRGFNLDEKQMHQAICATCGDSCEVPFKPNGRKPIYCRACFGGKEGAPERNDRFERKSAPEFRGGSDNSAELKAINAKLDLIMKALNLNAPAKAQEVKVEIKKMDAPVAVKAAEAKVEIKKVEAKKAEAVKAPAKKKAAAKKKK